MAREHFLKHSMLTPELLAHLRQLNAQPSSKARLLPKWLLDGNLKCVADNKNKYKNAAFQ